MIKKKKESMHEEHPSTQTTAIEGKEKEIENKIDTLLDKLPLTLTDKEKAMEKDALKKIFIEGTSPKEAMGFSDNMMNFFYSEAYKLYQAGQYKEANDRFKVLARIDPAPRYVLGLAASFHKMGNFDVAVPCYLLLATMEPHSPTPFYHASDCYMQQNFPDLALVMMQYAIERCGDDPKYAKLKERCYAMRSKLEDDLGTEKREN